MSNNIVANVTEFLVKLVEDRGFQNLLQNSSRETRAKLLEEAGYSFTKTEFETAAIEILDLKEQGQLDELSEDELVAVFGGGCYEMFAPVSQPSAGCMHGPVVGGGGRPITTPFRLEDRTSTTPTIIPAVQQPSLAEQ